MRDANGMLRYSKFEKRNFRQTMQGMKKTNIARFTGQHAAGARERQFIPEAIPDTIRKALCSLNPEAFLQISQMRRDEPQFVRIVSRSGVESVSNLNFEPLG